MNSIVFQQQDELPPAIAAMPRGVDGQPLYFTRHNLTDIDPKQARQLDVFAQISRTLTSKQLLELNTTGFSVLTPKQRQMVYGIESPYSDPKKLKFFQSLDENQIHQHLIDDIRRLSRVDSRVIRRKRQARVLSPSLLNAVIFDPGAVSNPSILSPVLLSLILFSPSIFGVGVLSPWLFLPVILSPRLMAPMILSPKALTPWILSPLLMNPIILSPACMLPLILSPTVLSPSILSPTLLSPRILSPLVLNPLIYSPTAVTAAIASPFLLSPAIWSPTYIAFHLFSPKALSPLINSTGKGVSLYFSPTIFS
ncbi:unnamed protein product [Gongylonema pulchrum]|uniref:Uncharacterized protein n=1 Tax=Gongylonema pulchrum TaxID=637853 RepID=A0A183E0C5_9BILA|nr:unnamed protein product [Gongylonema pulchrum]